MQAKPTCSIDGCDKKRLARGYCAMHWRRWRYGQDMVAPPRAKNKGKLCTVEGCGRGQEYRNLCRLHYKRWRTRDGDIGPPGLLRVPSGSGTLNNGYRQIHVNGRVVLEHRHVMEQMLGRPLLPTEQVHHRNGQRLDNDRENLELWITRHPTGQRVRDQLAWAHELIERYANVPDEVL